MSGFVYFIACEPMAAVKIGFTKFNPLARLNSLQTGCPARLKLLAYFPGTIDDERRLHEAFAPLHIRLEWFRLEWKLESLIVYLDDDSSPAASRQQFEYALHDVLMQGAGWHPSAPISDDQYYATGDWEPFRALLWEKFGPWEDA